MGFGGWAAPFPFQVGGGPTVVEKLYDAMRASVGTGHAADKDGLEWRWRQAKARALAAGTAAMEQAFCQFEPQFSGAGLAYYRELFQIPEGLSDQEARELAAFLFHDQGGIDVPTVRRRLQDLDPRFEVKLVPAELIVAANPGCRAFEPWDGSRPFNIWGRRETRFANHSTAFRLLATLVCDEVGDRERASIRAARQYLDGGVAYNDYSIAIGFGFRLGRSPLGRVRFGV